MKQFLFTLLFATFLGSAFTQTYCEVERELDGGTCISPDYLRFVFEEEYAVPAGTLLDYKVYDMERNLVANLPDLLVTKGRNYLEIQTTTLGMQYGKFFVMEITGSKGDKRYLRYQYTHTGQAQQGGSGSNHSSGGP